MSNQQQPKQESEQIVKVLKALAGAASSGMPPNGRPSESLTQLVRQQAENNPKPEKQEPSCEPKKSRFCIATVFHQVKRIFARLFDRER